MTTPPLVVPPEGVGWSASMVSLNIGCGKNPFKDSEWVNLDISGDPDVLCDLEQAKLPFPDDTFDAVHADHVLEHITRLLPLAHELWRVAKPGSVLSANVPYAGADVAFEDPTHVRFFTPQGLSYFSQPIYWRSDYGYQGDWKMESLGLACPAEVWEEFGEEYISNRWMHDRNLVVELRAVWRCVKPARASGIPPQDPIPAYLVPINYQVGVANESGPPVAEVTGNSY